MKPRFALMLIAAVLLWPAADVCAARLTEVLDANDGADGPVDFTLEAAFTHETEWAMITRERNTLNTLEMLMLNQDEFVYKNVKYSLDINGRVGMYRDLEFHFTLPITLSDSHSGWQAAHWREKYWGGAYGTDSNIGSLRPSLLSDGSFGFPSWRAVRQGFGDMTLGFSYAPLSNERDPHFPSLAFTLDLLLPTGPQVKPRLDPSGKNLFEGTNPKSGVGERLFAFVLKTAISMRAGAADPYLGMHWKLPIATGGLISKPRQQGGFDLGTEAVAYERKPAKEREPQYKIAFDFRFSAELYGKGQAFNEIVDPLAWRRNQDDKWADDTRKKDADANDYYYFFNGKAPAYKLPVEENFAYVQGLIGFYMTLAHYLNLRADFMVGHRTEHFLSVAPKVDARTLRPADRSGYNTPINEVGARVKKEQSLVFSYTLSLGVTY